MRDVVVRDNRGNDLELTFIGKVWRVGRDKNVAFICRFQLL